MLDAIKDARGPGGSPSIIANQAKTVLAGQIEASTHDYRHDRDGSKDCISAYPNATTQELDLDTTQVELPQSNADKGFRAIGFVDADKTKELEVDRKGLTRGCFREVEASVIATD